MAAAMKRRNWMAMRATNRSYSSFNDVASIQSAVLTELEIVGFGADSGTLTIGPGATAIANGTADGHPAAHQSRKWIVYRGVYRWQRFWFGQHDVGLDDDPRAEPSVAGRDWSGGVGRGSPARSALVSVDQTDRSFKGRPEARAGVGGQCETSPLGSGRGAFELSGPRGGCRFDWPKPTL